MEFFDLLDAPIDTLEFTKEFCEQCKLMNFDTLRKITDITAEQPMKLINTKGFTYHWFEELMEFFIKHKQMRLLQPLPGQIR